MPRWNNSKAVRNMNRPDSLLALKYGKNISRPKMTDGDVMRVAHEMTWDLMNARQREEWRQEQEGRLGGGGRRTKDVIGRMR